MYSGSLGSFWTVLGMSRYFCLLFGLFSFMLLYYSTQKSLAHLNFHSMRVFHQGIHFPLIWSSRISLLVMPLTLSEDILIPLAPLPELLVHFLLTSKKSFGLLDIVVYLLKAYFHQVHLFFFLVVVFNLQVLVFCLALLWSLGRLAKYIAQVFSDVAIESDRLPQAPGNDVHRIF